MSRCGPSSHRGRLCGASREENLNFLDNKPMGALRASRGGRISMLSGVDGAEGDDASYFGANMMCLLGSEKVN